MPEVAELIKKRRKIGVTQSALAVAAGITPAALCLIESGKTVSPAFRTISALQGAIARMEKQEAA